MRVYQQLIEQYGFTGARPEFYTVWTDPSDGDFSKWLTRAYLEDVNERYTRLAEEPFEVLWTAAQQLAADPVLCRFARYCRGILFESGYHEDYIVKLGFPRPATGRQLLDDFFGLLVHLSGIDVVEARYTARNIPLEFMRASYNSVRIWVDTFHADYGRWGHNREKPRMVYIEHLRIIRIGRLEFERNYFYGKIIVLRNRKDGSVLAMSEGGVPVTEAGYVSGTNDIWEPNAWYTVFDETDDCYKGHLIVDGKISPEVSLCRKDAWEAVIRRGQYSLGMHIPRDGRLNNQEVVESLRQAAAFYPAYFPEKNYRAFECHTWLFDPQLPGMLGENSGIVQFQKLFYRFPEERGDHGTMVSVFTELPFELADWKPSSSLQRKIIEHYANGGRMFGAGGFILPDGEIPPKRCF